MKSMIFLAVVAVIAAAVIGALSKGSKKPLKEIRPKAPLTPREQSMFFRLAQAFPEHVILAQVSLGALLQSRDQGTRNRFTQKVADFVICTKSFDVVSVIELDDASHRNRKGSDAARDAMLNAANIKTLRYANVPDPDQLLSDVNQMV